MLRLFRLKSKPESDEYPPDICAASRCTATPMVVDASGAVWAGKTPLCDAHWTHRCDWQDAQP